MKNPTTPEQVQLVIDNLTKAADLADNNCPVDMRSTKIDRDHPCGTPMCHAGWYGLVSTKGNNFLHGSLQMANDLGFKYRYDLQDWAGNNPEIWGNENGAFMFGESKAFGLEPQDLTSLHQIIEHWKGVQQRLTDTLKCQTT